MTDPRVVILDDSPSRREVWRSEITRHLAVTASVDVEFEAVDLELNERRRNSRDGNAWRSSSTLAAIDSADILVIDYELERDKQSPLSGEGIAYLARCFSTAGLIVVVNQGPKEPTFDLNLLGDLVSFADLNIADAELAFESLWKDRSGKDEYSPCYWPELSLEWKKHRERCDTEILERPLHTAIGLRDEWLPELSKTVVAMLGAGAAPLEQTVRSFVLNSGICLRSAENRSGRLHVPDGQLASIAAARLAAWARTILLQLQDSIVDLPHLLERFPGLLKDPSSIETWNRSLSHAHWQDHVRYELLEEHRLSSSFWGAVPVFHWSAIRQSDAIRSVGLTAVPERFVLCEDTTTFRRREATTEFSIGAQSAYPDRRIARLAQVRYEPAMRFGL